MVQPSTQCVSACARGAAGLLPGAAELAVGERGIAGWSPDAAANIFDIIASLLLLNAASPE